MGVVARSSRLDVGAFRSEQGSDAVDTSVDTSYFIVETEADMRVQVKKWGNSASVRIPASIMAAAALKIDQPVEVHEEEGRVIIEPITAPSYDLDSLLSKMTPDSFPEEIDFGRAVGNESW